MCPPVVLTSQTRPKTLQIQIHSALGVLVWRALDQARMTKICDAVAEFASDLSTQDNSVPT